MKKTFFLIVCLIAMNLSFREDQFIAMRHTDNMFLDSKYVSIDLLSLEKSIYFGDNHIDLGFNPVLQGSDGRFLSYLNEFPDRVDYYIIDTHSGYVNSQAYFRNPIFFGNHILIDRYWTSRHISNSFILVDILEINDIGITPIRTDTLDNVGWWNLQYYLKDLNLYVNKDNNQFIRFDVSGRQKRIDRDTYNDNKIKPSYLPICDTGNNKTLKLQAGRDTLCFETKIGDMSAPMDIYSLVGFDESCYIVLHSSDFDREWFQVDRNTGRVNVLEYVPVSESYSYVDSKFIIKDMPYVRVSKKQGTSKYNLGENNARLDRAVSNALSDIFSELPADVKEMWHMYDMNSVNIALSLEVNAKSELETISILSLSESEYSVCLYPFSDGPVHDLFLALEQGVNNVSEGEYVYHCYVEFNSSYVPTMLKIHARHDGVFINRSPGGE